MSTLILEYMYKQRNGMYCHALEVSTTYEIECTIENFVSELKDQFTKEDFKEFFNSIELHFLEDESLSEEENTENEKEVYNFNMSEVIDYLF